MCVRFEIGWYLCRFLSRVERKIWSVKFCSRHLPPTKKIYHRVYLFLLDIYFQISPIRSPVWSRLWLWAFDCVVVTYMTRESPPSRFPSRPSRFYSQPWDLLWNLDILLSTLNEKLHLFGINSNSMWRREISRSANQKRRFKRRCVRNGQDYRIAMADLVPRVSPLPFPASGEGNKRPWKRNWSLAYNKLTVIFSASVPQSVKQFLIIIAFMCFYAQA